MIIYVKVKKFIIELIIIYLLLYFTICQIEKLKHEIYKCSLKNISQPHTYNSLNHRKVQEYKWQKVQSINLKYLNASAEIQGGDEASVRHDSQVQRRIKCVVSNPVENSEEAPIRSKLLQAVVVGVRDDDVSLGVHIQSRWSAQLVIVHDPAPAVEVPEGDMQAEEVVSSVVSHI